MKILTIDTSSNICGVSILDDTNLVCNLDSDTGRTHSENLMPMIEDIFKKTNLSLKDIDLIVCDKGPGSFTGIRIGISTVKAFHDSLDIDCIGISSLEALAYNIKKDGLICSIIDCKNDNCYFALYEKKGKIFNCLIEPQAEDIKSTISILQSYCEDNLDNSPLIFVGDGLNIYKDILQSAFTNCSFANSNENTLNSYSLGLAGLNKYKENIDVNDILPLYLKKTQAQRNLEKLSN